jgi:hypothetical protein
MLGVAESRNSACAILIVPRCGGVLALREGAGPLIAQCPALTGRRRWGACKHAARSKPPSTPDAAGCGPTGAPETRQPDASWRWCE